MSPDTRATTDVGEKNEGARLAGEGNKRPNAVKLSSFEKFKVGRPGAFASLCRVMQLGGHVHVKISRALG